MNSVLRLMRLCLLNIGRSRQARTLPLTDRWLLAFGQSGEKSGPSPPFSCCLKRAFWMRGCFSSGRIVGRCARWNICSSLTCSCLPLVLAWQATFTQGSVPSFYSLGGVFLTRPACTCQKRCQLSDFIFTVHTERLSDGQPISDSPGACADRWGYGGEIIVRSAPWHNACQAQTHL